MMIWLVSIFLPLVLAPVVLFGGFRSGWYGAIVGGAALPAFVAGLLAPATAEIPWLLLESSFGLDQTRQALLSFTALLWGFAGIYAGSYLRNDPSRKSFGFFFLLAMAGNLGLIVSQDVPGFYTYFVLMTFASYGMVIHARTREALRAGRIYLIMSIMGEILLLAGIYFVVAAADSFLLEDMGPALGAMENRNVALSLLLAGFGVKAGAIPLYFWLPLAHPVAPTPASAVLSGAMIKAGLLGWIHFSPAGSAAVPGWSGILIAAGLLAAFGAVVIGLFQNDSKTNLAYSSISQMGLMTVLFGTGLASMEAWETAAPALALYAWNHGLAKGALFLGVGVALAARRGNPWVTAGLAFAALSIAGAPLTGGEFTKYGLKETVVFAPDGWRNTVLWLLPLSALGTSLLLGRFLWLCWHKMGTAKEQGSARTLGTPWVVLLGLVAVGVPFANTYLGMGIPRPSLGFGSFVEAIGPIAAGAAILAAAARIPARKRYFPNVPPGDFIVVFERLVTFVRETWRKKGLPDVTHGPINFVPIVDRLITMEGTRGIMDRVERRLGAWNVVGVLIALIALGFYFLLI